MANFDDLEFDFGDDEISFDNELDFGFDDDSFDFSGGEGVADAVPETQEGGLSKVFSNIGGNIAGAFTDATDKIGRGVDNLQEGKQFLDAVGVKTFNKMVGATGLISDKTQKRIDERYGGENVSSTDLLNKARKELGLGAGQSILGGIETILSPLTGLVTSGIEGVVKVEEKIRGGEAETANKIFDFIGWAEKEIGDDVLDTFGYTTSDYSPQEAADIGAGIFDLVEGGAALKGLTKINGKVKSEKKIKKSIDEGNIEAAAETIIDTPIEVEPNLQVELDNLSKQNNITLQGYADTAKKLGIDTTNIDNLINNASSADYSLAFNPFMKTKTTKATKYDAEVKSKLDELDTSTPKKRDEAYKLVAEDTGLSTNRISEIANKNDFKLNFNPVDDFTELSILNGKRNTAVRGNSDIGYNDVNNAYKSDLLTRLEDQGLVVKDLSPDNGNLYGFKATPEGEKVLSNNGIDPESINTTLNKDVYDSHYVTTSFEVKQSDFNSKARKVIENDIKFGLREFGKLKELAIKTELGNKSPEIQNDILTTIDTLNNRYNLKLDDKIKKVLDLDGVIDTDVLTDIIKSINEFAKKDFANIRNLKKQASTLVARFDIDSKLKNSVLKDDTISIERGLSQVMDKKAQWNKAKKEATTIRDLEKAYVLGQDYRLRKLQVESKVDKNKAVKEYMLGEVKELAKDSRYFGDVPKIMKELNKEGFFDVDNETDLRKQIREAQKLISDAQVQGLYKAIKDEIGKFGESSKEIQVLGGTDNLLKNFQKGNSSLENLYELLLRIKEIKETSKKDLELERKENVKINESNLEKIREEGIVNLKGTIEPGVAGETKFLKTSYAVVRKGFNELNFMFRILERIGEKSKAFKDIFLFEVDSKYNNVQGYKDKVVDKIVVDIDKNFKSAKERIGLGQYLMLFRRSVDENGFPEYQGYEKLKGDKSSWLNVERTPESLEKSPNIKPLELDWMTDEMWQTIRVSKLGEVLEAGLKDNKYKKIQKKINRQFKNLRTDSDSVTRLYDNAEVREVVNYLPLYKRGEMQSADFAGFDDPDVVSGNINDSFTKNTTDAKLTYEYDVAKLVSRGMMDQKYYSEMRPQFEKMKDIMYGKKVDDTLYDTDAVDGNTLIRNRKGGLVNDMDPETQRILDVYLERVRRGGDKYSAIGNIFNKAVGYVNNQYLGFNPGTILKQPLGFMDAAGIIGTRNMSWAMRALLDRKLSAQALEASATLRNRFGGQISVRDLETVATGKVGRGFKQFQKTSVAGIMLADQFTATKVWMAAYRKFLQENGLLKDNKQVLDFNNKEGVEYADIMMQKAMSTVNPLFLPPAYRSIFTRAIGQLMTTQLNRLGILFNDIPDLVRGKEYKRAAVGFTGWTLSSISDKVITAAMGYMGYQLGIYTWKGYDQDFLTLLLGDEDERLQKIGSYVLSDLFGGQAVQALFSGDDLTVVGGFVSQIFKDVNKIATADDAQERVQGFFDLTTDLGGTWVGRRTSDFYQNYSE